MSVDADEVPGVPEVREVPEVPVVTPVVTPEVDAEIGTDTAVDVAAGAAAGAATDTATDTATGIAAGPDLAVVPAARVPIASVDPRPSEPLPPEALGPDTAAAVVPSPASSAPALRVVPDPAPDPAPPADPAPSRPSVTGRRGRYRVDEMLGRGGASAVHRGWDRLLHRPVALKLLSYEVQPQPDDRHREARVVAGLDHPGLVPVYDVSRLDGHDAVVMQLIDGPSLAERLREGGPLPLAETLRLGAEVADGLAHVHTHDIVHRDVKPANILLAEGGARLTDFGIARAPGATTLTGQGLILGTAAYLAPEQVRHGDAPPAVDLFALGLVLVECLTGTPCYPSSPSECAARLETPAALPDDVPERVRELLAALTDLDPAARPTAEEASTRLGALADLLDAEGVDALDTPSPEVVRARPVPFASAVVGLLLVTAVVAGVLALVHGRPDLGVPVLVAAVAAQGAVLWNGRRASRPGPPPGDGKPGPGGGRPAAPAGP